MTIGLKIAALRREQGMTQEALAQKLGVTNQAVSKWESEQSCPDIQLLPRLADTFGVTIDELFGRPAPEAQVKYGTLEGLPWENDNTLRAVLYVGHTLVGESRVDRHPEAQKLTFTYEGPALNVDSYFAVSCGDVAGNVDAGDQVQCQDVGGDVDAGSQICCGNVGGDADAGSSITCGSVGGDVDAGAWVQCGNVSGDVDAGTDVTCTRVEGDIDAGRVVYMVP